VTVRLGMAYSEVDVDRVQELAYDVDVVFEQKMDGTRVLSVIKDSGVEFYQRGGKPLAHAAAKLHTDALAKHLQRLLGDTPGEFVLDGELLIRTGELFLFDVPYVRIGGVEMLRPTEPYGMRRMFLDRTIAAELDADGPVKIVPSARTRRQKLAMFEEVRAAGAEGVMAKALSAPYEPGARVKHSVKIKFVKTADVVVTAVDRPDAKHGSFTFGVVAPPGVPLDQTMILDPLNQVPLVDLGKCSAIGKPNAQVGDVIEVAYLYRDDSGGLVQPRMMRIREDKPAAECTIDQFPTYSRELVQLPDPF